MIRKITFLIIFCVLGLVASADNSGRYIVEIKTSAGTVVVKLYDDTPIHRDNFLKLARSGFYEGIIFHRVINDFMIQAGDPKSKEASMTAKYGVDDSGYRLPAEIVKGHYHYRGALAAARQSDALNPMQESSGSQFYIVDGHKFTDDELKPVVEQLEKKREDGLYYRLRYQNPDKSDEQIEEMVKKEVAAAGPISIPENVANIYKTVGGTPHLDDNYTVFGEVVDGMAIVEKIAATPTDSNDRPNDDIYIIKMTVKQAK